MDVAAQLLRGERWHVRVLACRPRTGEAQADVTVPTRFLGTAGWPLPVGGWRLLWREVGAADVVIANGTRHLLPSVAAFAARLRGKRVLFVLHGSGAPFSTSSFFYHRVLGRLFERLVTRPALRRLAAGLPLARRRRRRPLAVRGGGHLRPVSAPRAAACDAGPARAGRAAADRLGRPALRREEPARGGRAGRAGAAPAGCHGSTSTAAARCWRRSRSSRGIARGSPCEGRVPGRRSSRSRARPISACRPPCATRRRWRCWSRWHEAFPWSRPASAMPPATTNAGCGPSASSRGTPEAAVEAILALADSYDRYRKRFAANAHELVRRHRDGATAPGRGARIAEFGPRRRVRTGAAERGSPVT